MVRASKKTGKKNRDIKKNIDIYSLQRETLKNILSSKGIIYRYYLRHLQQKHQ